MSDNTLSMYSRNRLRDAVRTLAERNARLELFYTQQKAQRPRTDRKACEEELVLLSNAAKGLVEKLVIILSPKFSDSLFTDAIAQATEQNAQEDVVAVFSYLSMLDCGVSTFHNPEETERVALSLQEHAQKAFNPSEKVSKRLPRTADRFDGRVKKFSVYDKAFPSWVQGDVVRPRYTVYCISGPDGDYLGLSEKPELAFAKHLQRAKEDDSKRKQRKSYLQREISLWGVEEFELSLLQGFDSQEHAKKALHYLRTVHKSTTHGYNRKDPAIIEERAARGAVKASREPREDPKPSSPQTAYYQGLSVSPVYKKDGTLRWVRRTGSGYIARVATREGRRYLGTFNNALDAHYVARDAWEVFRK